jgi:hypothetical protein
MELVVLLWLLLLLVVVVMLMGQTGRIGVTGVAADRSGRWRTGESGRSVDAVNEFRFASRRSGVGTSFRVDGRDGRNG